MPFTVNQFLDVFAAYNAAIWPAQIGAYAFAVVILVALFSQRPSAVRGAMAALAVLWAFIGIGYHLMFFATINPAAPVFAGFFVLQAVLFAVNAVGPGNLRFHLGRDVRTWAGLVATVYALAIYPVVGAWAGHGLMAGPMFGVAPCPTTIFTLGILLLLRGGWVIALSVVALLWSFIGMAAAVQLGILEDLGMPVAGLALLTAHGVQILRSRRDSKLVRTL